MSGKRKIILAAGVCSVAVAGLAVAAWLYINRFQPEEYVKAVLDVSYKKQTAEYMEMTGASQKKAEAVFEDNLDATMAQFDSSAMPEDMKPLYRQLFGEIAMNVSYTVCEAKKEESGKYVVPVLVKPVTLFSDTYDEFRQKAEEYADEVTDSVMNGAQMPSEEEMQDEVYRIYYEVLSQTAETGMKYGAEAQVALHVYKNEDGDYEIDSGDMEQLDKLMIKDEDGTEQ